MTFHWNYPIYVIPLGGGFASVVDAAETESPTHALAVFTEQRTVMHFMAVCGLSGTPRTLDNAHQFAWLLQSLQKPVAQVAFDPAADQKQLSAAWMVTVEELLQHTQVAERSPWKYPLFVVMHATGFASIEGQADDGENLTAVCLFTQRDKAQQYLAEAASTGEVFALEDRETVLEFLRKISSGATAVALDPAIHDGSHVAQYCVDIETLVEKIEDFEA